MTSVLAPDSFPGKPKDFQKENTCLIFKSFSHFEFIFVHGVGVCSNFIALHAAVQVCVILKSGKVMPPARFFFCFFIFFYFPTVQQGDQVILRCIHCSYSFFSPTLSSVVT